MNGSRSFTQEETRRVPRNRNRQREDFIVQPSARKPTTRVAYSEVEKAEPVIRVHDTVRVVAVIDQWDSDRACGFAICPELDCEVFFLHVTEFEGDKSRLAVGVTIELTPCQNTRPVVPSSSGRPPRRIAKAIRLVEPITREVHTMITRIDNRGNAWLHNFDAATPIYFRSNHLPLNIGDHVTALVYDAPRGPRATRVQRIAP